MPTVAIVGAGLIGRSWAIVFARAGWQDYVVSDGTAQSAAKSVSLAIAPVNDAPTASGEPETARGAEDTAIRGKVLPGADVDGDALLYSVVEGSARHGTVMLDSRTGDYLFTPDRDWNGAASFAYVVSDGTASSAPKTVTLTLDSDANASNS